MTETQVYQLQRAYVERKRWEAQMHWSVYFKAMSGGENKAKQASLHELAMMGFGVQ